MGTHIWNATDVAVALGNWGRWFDRVDAARTDAIGDTARHCAAAARQAQRDYDAGRLDAGSVEMQCRQWAQWKSFREAEGLRVAW